MHFYRSASTNNIHKVLLLKMHQLSSSTVRLLSSSQVITSVISVVKELIENALDAQATNISVKLENFGFDKIEVRDNGLGIKAADTSVMALKHYTSKISCHEDLETLQTYGFRGEALGSICSIAEVHIATKTATDPVSTQYFLDNNGHVVSQKLTHLGQGTTVSVMKLFKNLPVRKQYYSNAKKCKEELKKIQDLLISYGLIKPDVRIVLVHNKVIIWQKNKEADHKMALTSVLGTTVMNAMAPFQHQNENLEIFMNGYLPRPEADRTLTCVHGPEKSFIFINQRPVLYKEILKMVRLHYIQNQDSSRCYPIFFMNIVVPASSVDVNLTPDKTQVLLQNKELVLEAVENVLKSMYPDVATLSICKPEAQCKDVKMSGTKSPCTDHHTKMFIGNESMLLEDKSEKEIHSSVHLKCHSSNRDHSPKSDPKKVSGENFSFSLDQRNQCNDTLNGSQKDAEVSCYSVTNTPEVLRNTASGYDFLITDDTWSKGNALRNSTGENIQPVMVLCPDGSKELSETALCTSQIEDAYQETTNKIREKSGSVTAYDLVNNQVIKKPVTAIDIFTQEHKAKVLNYNPKVQFDEVPSVILELWEQLSEEDKLRYEDKATKDLQRYKTHAAKASEGKRQAIDTGKKMKLKLEKSPAQRIKLKTPMSNQQILDTFFYSQAEHKTVVPTIKTIKVNFNLNNLKHQLHKLGRKEKFDFGEPVLISNLKRTGAWIVASKCSVDLLNPYRVEEALMYKRLVETHKFPVEKLDLPIVLNDRLFGGPEYFTALLSMQKDEPRPNGHVNFSDARLIYNGFQIKMIPDASADLMGMTARSAALANAARRTTWLKLCSGDAGSKNKFIIYGLFGKRVITRSWAQVILIAPYWPKRVLVLAALGDGQRELLRTFTSSAPPSPGPSGTSDSAEPPSNSLDVERDCLSTRGLSDKVISTLLMSRKAVTSRIYHQIWRVFLNFTKGRWDQSFAPDISLILDFLKGRLDKGLSVSTLKVQVASFSVFLDFRMAESPLVKIFLKGASRLHPPCYPSVPP
ncbi:PMS1 protein homolog 1 isoform X4 [Engystomops pustulosus]|uniref:PMS1 protein homolog 1 isoform X4 n=1 Tax=Engystomops pustulosus TaxID=76066 RepID=UPI003AFB6EB3